MAASSQNFSPDTPCFVFGVCPALRARPAHRTYGTVPCALVRLCHVTKAQVRIAVWCILIRLRCSQFRTTVCTVQVLPTKFPIQSHPTWFGRKISPQGRKRKKIEPPASSRPQKMSVRFRLTDEFYSIFLGVLRIPSMKKIRRVWTSHFASGREDLKTVAVPPAPPPDRYVAPRLPGEGATTCSSICGVLRTASPNACA